jgi:hypothetical protein
LVRLQVLGKGSLTPDEKSRETGMKRAARQRARKRM